MSHRYWRSCQETAKKQTLAYRIAKPSTDLRTQIAPVRLNEKVDVSGDVLENSHFYMVVKMESFVPSGHYESWEMRGEGLDSRISIGVHTSVDRDR